MSFIYVFYLSHSLLDLLLLLPLSFKKLSELLLFSVYSQSVLLQLALLLISCSATGSFGKSLCYHTRYVPKRKKTSPKRAVKKEQRSPILEKDLKDSIIIIVLIVIAIFLFLAQFQVAGIVGDKTYLVAHGLLGVGYILLPVTFLFLTIAILRSATKSFSWLSATAAFFFLASGLSLVEVFGQNGGALGRTLAHPLINLFETWMAGIISFGIGTAALLVLFRVSLRKIAEDYQERQEEKTYCRILRRSLKRRT